MTEDSGSASSDEDPHLWEYTLGFVTIPVLVASVMLGAYFLTPGDPFSCGFVTSRAPWLCPWMREYKGNVYMLTFFVFGGTVSVVMVVSYSRLFLGELLNR